MLLWVMRVAVKEEEGPEVSGLQHQGPRPAAGKTGPPKLAVVGGSTFPSLPPSLPSSYLPFTDISGPCSVQVLGIYP